MKNMVGGRKTAGGGQGAKAATGTKNGLTKVAGVPLMSRAKPKSMRRSKGSNSEAGSSVGTEDLTMDPSEDEGVTLLGVVSKKRRGRKAGASVAVEVECMKAEAEKAFVVMEDGEEDGEPEKVKHRRKLGKSVSEEVCERAAQAPARFLGDALSLPEGLLPVAPKNNRKIAYIN